MICYGTMKVTGITERNIQKCLVLSEIICIFAARFGRTRIAWIERIK